MKTSLDFNEKLFTAFRAHCKGAGLTMTEALESAMSDVLRVNGKLPGDPFSEVVQEAAELIRQHGPTAVRNKLNELADEVAEISGGGK